MAHAAARGWPLARHPVLHYPEDRTLLADGAAAAGGAAPRIRQFLLGADLLVLSVLAPGVSVVRGYFPCGVWLYLWASEEATRPDDAIDACASRGGEADGPPPQGRWLTVAAPLGYPAVYARAAANATYTELRARMRAAGLLEPYRFEPADPTPSERSASEHHARG